MNRGLSDILSGIGQVEIAKRTHSFKWTFTEIPLAVKFLHYYRCDMFGDGLNSTGFAEGFSPGVAILKCYAEAWERWWMFHLARADTDVKTTNGFAAGVNEKIAKQASFEELMERASVLAAWQEAKGWEKGPYFLGPKALLLKRLLRDNDWNLKLHTINVYKGHRVLGGFALHARFGMCFDSVYIGDTLSPFKFANKLSKLILSIYRATQLQQAMSLDAEFQLPEVGRPNDHAKFYRNPKNCSAYFDVVYGNSSPLNKRPPLVETRTLFSGSGIFPAVALTRSDNSLELSWGKSSINFADLWPHPIA